jgi:hypothetical protein
MTGTFPITVSTSLRQKESLAFLSTSLSSNKKNHLTPLQGPTER